MNADSNGVVGTPQITETLQFGGQIVSRNRVAILMVAHDLEKHRAPARQTRKRAAVPHPQPARAQNWVTDITRIRTAEVRLYLCVFLNLYHKAVVGCSMNARQPWDFVRKPLLMALWQRETCDESIVLHSDRGTQFARHDSQGFHRGHHLTCIMSTVGHCGDDAATEGFFGLRKRERVNEQQSQAPVQAWTVVFDHIEAFYSRTRRIAILAELVPRPSSRPSCDLSIGCSSEPTALKLMGVESFNLQE